MKEELKKLVAYLEDLASDEDMASVQINNEGNVILRIGCNYSEFTTIDKLVDAIEGQQ